MNPRAIIIGYDLGVEVSQIAIGRGFEEPDSISITSSGNTVIPTVLCVRSDSKDWLFGEEAERFNNRGAGHFVDDLVNKVIRDESEIIYEIEYSASELLTRFVRKTLSAVRQKYVSDEIGKVVVTMRTLHPRVVEAVQQAIEETGIGRDKAEFQPYVMSFMYYAVCQRRDYWINDVGLFDYNENGLFYYQMSNNSRKGPPLAITTVTADLSDLMDAAMLENMQEARLQYSFRLVRDKVIQRQIISTIYVTGKGFEGTWPDEILKSMTSGRHVFKGSNLYAKGAAYCGQHKDDEQFADYLFLTEDMVRSTISIRMFKDNRVADYPLIFAGEPWREAKATTVGILDDTDEIYFTVYNAVRKESKYSIMNLKNLHRRENKTTRVAVKVTFLDRDTAVCTVSDLGFGQFFPCSYRVWEKIIAL